MFAFVMVLALGGRSARALTLAECAATSPGPWNAPGLCVAAIAGWPPLADASNARFLPASCTCWVCAVVIGVWCSLSAESSCAFGRAVVPPVPPLKLVRFTVVLLLITVVL